MTMADDHFIRQSFVLISATLLASVINYLFQFSMGRLLGPADYGALAALFSIIYIAVAPVQAVQLTLTKFVAEFKSAAQPAFVKELLVSALKKLFIASAGLFAAVIVASAWLADFLNMPSKRIIFYFSFIFLAMFVLAAARGVLQGMQKFKALGINIVLESAIKLSLCVGFVLAGFGLAGAIFGTNISVFVAFALMMFVLLRMLAGTKGQKLDEKQKTSIYLYSLPMLVALSSITALYSADVLLVKHFFAPAEAGIYAAAALVAKLIFFALMPISQVMFPKVAELEAKKQSHFEVFIKSVVLVACLSAIAVAVYFIRPDFVLNLLFGREYAGAIPLIGMFGLAIAVLSISYVFINYFLSAGKSGFVFVLPVFVFAEALLIWQWHRTLQQVIIAITGTMAGLLLALILIYFYYAIRNRSP